MDPLINRLWEQLFKELSMDQDKQSLPTVLHVVHKEIPKDLLKSLVSWLRDHASFRQLKEYYYEGTTLPLNNGDS